MKYFLDVFPSSGQADTRFGNVKKQLTNCLSGESTAALIGNPAAGARRWGSRGAQRLINVRVEAENPPPAHPI